ncbi:AMP-binding protein, partial [Streptomyces albus]
MTTNNSGTRQPQHDLTAELNFLSRALKAPTLRDAAGRLTERAREESWTHEEFLVACLQREVSARESHGGESRIRAARFPARKSLEEFDFDHARGLQRDAIAHLNTWHGRPHDRRSDVAALQDLLPTVRSTVHVPVLTDALAVADAHAWADILARPAPVQFERVDFNDPLWVLYSSGTTGIPKGIVHSHGGVLLEHYKLLGLHHDLGPGDRFFWYTTT